MLLFFFVKKYLVMYFALKTRKWEKQKKYPHDNLTEKKSHPSTNVIENAYKYFFLKNAKKRKKVPVP
tara:strand:- start:7781 stop:7981 length:201 start_codon:yes stop_codon:yes gene_type:complete